MMVPELEIVSMRWVANLPPPLYVMIILGGTYFTLFFEISCVFLIWNRVLRPRVTPSCAPN